VYTAPELLQVKVPVLVRLRVRPATQRKTLFTFLHEILELSVHREPEPGYTFAHLFFVTEINDYNIRHTDWFIIKIIYSQPVESFSNE
jgi:hypothetical protein